MTIETLVKEYLNLAWRSLRRFGLSEADADDAAQEVFIILAQKIESIDAGKESAYLISVCRRVASAKRRSLQRRREEYTSSSKLPIAGGHSPEELNSLREAREQLDMILDEMPENVRAVFVLYELEKKTTKEIAELLKIPPGTVSTRLRKGRDVFTTATAQLRKKERVG
ncbi:MAG: sigma-70 family RNA polymerase sigma factor [Polyangiaceae bacterium]|nr:sigma-70 family RNA polymerase sigma factor [Polyangiaceae bacterium]